MSRRLAVLGLLLVALLAASALAHEGRPFGRYHDARPRKHSDKDRRDKNPWRSSSRGSWHKMKFMSEAAAAGQEQPQEEGEYQGVPQTGEEGTEKKEEERGGWHRRRHHKEHDGERYGEHRGRGRWWRHHKEKRQKEEGRKEGDAAAATVLTVPKEAQCRLCVASLSQAGADQPARPMKFCLKKQLNTAAPPTDDSGQCVPVDQDCEGGLDAEIRTLAQCPNDAPETKTSCSSCTLDGYTWCSSSSASSSHDDDDDDEKEEREEEGGKGRCVDRSAWRGRKERKGKEEGEKDGKKWHKKKGKHHHGRRRFCANAITLPQQCPTETAPNPGTDKSKSEGGHKGGDWKRDHGKTGSKEKEKEKERSGKDGEHDHDLSDEEVEDAIGALIFFGLVFCFALFIVREGRRRRRQRQGQPSVVPGAPGPFVAVPLPQPQQAQHSQQQQPQAFMHPNAVRVHVPSAASSSSSAAAPVNYHVPLPPPSNGGQQQQQPMYYVYYPQQLGQQQQLGQPVLIPVAHPVPAAAQQHHHAVEMQHMAPPPPPSAPHAAASPSSSSPVTAAVVASPVEGTGAGGMYPSLGRNGYSRLPTDE